MESNNTTFTPMPIWGSDICFDDKNNIWIAHGIINGLLKYNVKTNRVEFKCVIDEEELVEEMLFSSIIYNNDTIILVPYNAKGLYVYNILTDQYNKIYEGRKYNGFIGGVLYNNCVYCVPYNRNCSADVIKISLNDYSFEKYDDIWSKISINDFKLNDYAICKNYFIGVFEHSESILLYNIESKEVELYNVDSIMELNTVCENNGHIYFYGKDSNKILEFNMKTKTWDREINANPVFGRLLEWKDNRVLLDDSRSGLLYIYNVDNGVSEKAERTIVDKWNKNIKWKYGYGVTKCIDNNKYVYHDRNNCEILLGDLFDNQVISLLIEEDELLKWKCKSIRCNNGMLQENSITGFTYYLDALCNE